VFIPAGRRGGLRPQPPGRIQYVDVFLSEARSADSREFEEAPGLSLTLNEAARFWGLDRVTCERLLTELLLIGFLRRGSDQRYYHVV
jgi:Fic family protein